MPEDQIGPSPTENAIRDALQRQSLLQQMQPPYTAEEFQYKRELTSISDGVPPNLQNTLWSFTNKVFQLTNIDKKTAERLDNRSALIIDYLEINTPKRYKGPMFRIDLMQIRSLHLAAIERAVDGFERLNQNTTRNEGTYSYINRQPQSMGLINRILGRRR